MATARAKRRRIYFPSHRRRSFASLRMTRVPAFLEQVTSLFSCSYRIDSTRRSREEDCICPRGRRDGLARAGAAFQAQGLGQVARGLLPDARGEAGVGGGQERRRGREVHRALLVLER